MVKTLTDLILSSILLTSLVVLVSTSSNLIWLSSMNLPMDFNLVTSTFLSDIIGIYFNSEIPLYLLISLPFVLFLSITKALLKKTLSSPIFLYSLAGAISMLCLMILTPMALDNLEPISGSRTYIGKLCITACGIFSGYFFAVRQLKINLNENS